MHFADFWWQVKTLNFVVHKWLDLMYVNHGVVHLYYSN